jgi:cytochrome P450
VNICDACSEGIEQLFASTIYNFINPICHIFYMLTGRTISVSQFSRMTAHNAKVLRGFLKDYVQKRRQEFSQNPTERKSGSVSLENQCDLLSIFFQSPEVFTDDYCVAEILDFLVTGTETSEKAAQTMFAHFIKSKVSLNAVRS